MGNAMTANHAGRLTVPEAATIFGLIGLLVGAASIYFGPAMWTAAVGVLVIGAITKPALASVGGGAIGLAGGSAAILWIGTQCPPATTCEPGFELAPYRVFIGATLVIGVLCFAILITRRIGQ
jgi:hypothetical protein